MFSKILVLTNSTLLKKEMEIFFKNNVGVFPVILPFSSENEFFLDILPELGVLVMDERNFSDFALTESIILYYQTKGCDILLLSDRSEVSGNVTLFKELGSLWIYIESLYSLKKVSPMFYASAPLETLAKLGPLPFDLYVKLSEEKFVKRFPSFEIIDSEMIHSLAEKGISLLYYDRAFIKDFTALFMNSLNNRVEENYDCPIEGLIAVDEVYLTVKDIVGKLGFNSRIINVCESVIDKISESVLKFKYQTPLSNHLDFLLDHKQLSYRYRLMKLTSILAVQISETMGINERDIKKIVFSSMFCDISLQDHSQLSCRKIIDLKGLISETEKNVLQHALRSSEIVQKYSNAPLDADRIIRQHHGSLNGIGFPESFAPGLCPLAKCLIVAQEATFLMLDEFKTNPLAGIHSCRMKFVGTTLEQFFLALESNCVLGDIRRSVG